MKYSKNDTLDLQNDAVVSAADGSSHLECRHLECLASRFTELQRQRDSPVSEMCLYGHFPKLWHNIFIWHQKDVVFLHPRAGVGWVSNGLGSKLCLCTTGEVQHHVWFIERSWENVRLANLWLVTTVFMDYWYLYSEQWRSNGKHFGLSISTFYCISIYRGFGSHVFFSSEMLLMLCNSAGWLGILTFLFL